MKYILSFIITLLLSDIYIIIFNLFLPIYEKRQSEFTTKERETPNVYYSYKPKFKTRVKIFIVILSILGILVGLKYAPELSILFIIKNCILWQVIFLCFYATVMFCIGKVKKIYGEIRYSDKYYWMDKNEIQQKDTDLKNL